MKKFNTLSIAKLFLHSACGLLFLTSSVQAESFDYHHEEECNTCCWRAPASFAIGAVVAGGAALLVSNSKNDHSSGAKGPKGSPGQQYVADEGQTLTFNFDEVNVAISENPDAPTATVTLTPLISAPNGEVITGTSKTFTDFDFQADQLVTSLGSITITDPLFGTYEAGMLVVFENSSTFLNNIFLQLSVNVVASRDNSNTLILERDSYDETNFNGIPLQNQFQTSAEYAYGPANIP